MSEKDNSRYIIETVVQAGKVLEAVAHAKEPISQAEISMFTGLKPNTVFRLLCTLEEMGYTRRIGDRHDLDMKLALFYAKYKISREAERNRINKELNILEIKEESHGQEA